MAHPSATRTQVYVDAACLTWRHLFTAWFNKIKMESWLENHDVILQQLFEWLLPPLLACTATCRLAAAISPLNLVQGSLELFQVLLQEALPNLKERKYLRGWIQAGVVYACVWSLGGCLADEGERAKFDQGIREVIFGKRTDCPLPKSLNGKFDALPPIEVIDLISPNTITFFRASSLNLCLISKLVASGSTGTTSSRTWR